MTYWGSDCVAFAKFARAEIDDSTLWKGKTVLESFGQLQLPICVKCGEHSEYRNACKIRVTFDGPDFDDPTRGDESVHMTASPSHLYDDLTLHVQAPKSVEALFLQSIHKGIDLTVTGSLGLSGEREINIDPTVDHVTKKMKDAQLFWGIGEADPPKWVASNIKNLVWEQFKKYPLLHKSQVMQVYQEFADSYRSDVISLIPTEKEIDAIVEVISEVRSALRPYSKLSEDEYSFGSTWLSSPRDAKEISNKLSSDEAKIFREKYDTLWGTFNIYAIIQSGEKDFGALAQGFEPKVEEIEDVAHKLLDLDQRYFSPTLENLLINALIYAETVEFARNVHSKEKILGFSVPSPMKGTRSDKVDNPLVTLSKLLWKFFVEALSVGLTFAIAYFVTSQDVVSSWVITTGITLFRWALNEVKAIFKNDRMTQLELVSEMVMLHELTNKPILSSQYLYAEAVRVSQKGAAFKPVVFLLLERQINRQKRNVQHPHG